MRELDFHFDDVNHIYRMADGTIVPGVTRVIEHGGFDDYANVREDILEKKSILGREVHRTTRLYDGGKLSWASMDHRVAPRVEQWKRFREITGFTPTKSELRGVVRLNGYPYGFQIDAIGITKTAITKRPITTVVEKKTTVKIFPRHFIQTAGYAAAAPKGIYRPGLARFLAHRRLIVQLNGKGDPHIREADEREDFYIFAELLHIADWKRRHGVPMRMEQSNDD